jgi:hypothetical protein
MQGPGAAYVFDISRALALPGDFNNDGTVDAADYAVSRNGLGTTYAQTDYNTWRANFGRSAAGPAAVAIGNSIPAVPEPSTVWLVVCALTGVLHARASRRRIPRDPRHAIEVGIVTPQAAMPHT